MPGTKKKVVKKKATKKATKKAARKKPAGDVSQETALGTPFDLLCTQVDRHPDNRQPTKEAVNELAKSIDADGQLEACLVRQKGKRYQMLSGETRWLATKQLKRKQVKARLVYDCDDAKALRIVATGNLRKDLNTIERARLCKRLCDPVDDGGSGLSQAEAGELAGLSRSAVANAIRILDAPQSIIDLVADGRLPETFLREVLPALEAVPKLVEPAIKSAVGKTGFDGSRDQFAWDVLDRIYSKSRSLAKQTIPRWRETVDTSQHASCYFKPTDEQLAELQPVTVKRRWGSKERRATNVKLWTELQKAAFKRWQERQSKKSGKSKSKAGKGTTKKESAADIAAKEKQKADQLKKRLASFRINWLRYLIHKQILNCNTIEQRDDVAQVVMRLLIWSSVDKGREPSDSHGHANAKYSFRDDALELVFDRNETTKSRKRSHKPELSRHWAPLSGLDVDELFTTGTDYVAELFWHGDLDDGPTANHCIPAAMVNQVAEQLGINAAAAWKAERCGPLTDEFFELFTGDQLHQLAKFWKVPGWLGGVGTVADRRKILTNAPESKKTLPKGLAK